MGRAFDVGRLRDISVLPRDGRNEWLSDAESSVDFLKANVRSQEIVLFACTPAVLIHGVLAAKSKVTPPDQDDLLRSFVQLDDCWRVQRSYGGGEGHRVYIEPPLSSPGCKSLVGGEKLVFRRSFYGVHDGPAPIEISQKLVHCFDLHFMPERNAYCRLDSRGDIEDVIRIVELEAAAGWDGGTVVTMLAKDLSTYMTLSDMALVFRFDFTRFVLGGFTSWDGQVRGEHRAPDLFYNSGVVAGHASYVNGCMIVRPTATLADIVEEWQRELDPKNREYVAFKIFDRKNRVNVETSCAPEALSNYFQKSDLPWEISPAFFRADVLHRFKADPQKYTLDDRSIRCRAGWELKTYDINDAGQVHTYIGYLAKLPIEEQRYWQSFNEWPKGPISKRAFETDMLGQWSTGYDPLNAIKVKVVSLDEAAPAWWKPRGEELAHAARYPATESASEWGNEISALDQLLVEGFLVKPLRALAQKQGRDVDPSWGSLRVLEECLVGLGQKPDEAKEVVGPLRKLHALRNPLKAHGATAERKKTEREARTKFGTLRGHFTALATDCDKSLEQVIAALRLPKTEQS